MSEPPHERAIPLTYATLDADGLPDVLPDVEGAIDRGDSLRKIVKHFRKRRQADKYIAKSFRRRFNLHATSGKCICCGDATEHVASVGWGFDSRKHFRLGRDEGGTRVSTWHSLCGDCFVDWLRRTRMPRRYFAVGSVGTLIFFVSIFASLLFRRADRTVIDWVETARWSALAISVAASAVGAWLWHRAVPKPLKSVMPRWMNCNGWESFDARSDLLSEALRPSAADANGTERRDDE